MRISVVCFALCVVALSPIAASSDSALAAAHPPTQRDGQHDFDFLLGSWKSHYKVLRRPLTGSHDWYEFNGTNFVHPVWKGEANIDESYLYRPTGRLDALTLRLYDPATHQWSLYWGTAKKGLSIPPTVGHFDANGLGKFYDNETFAGKPITVRYTWMHPKPDTWHFEQAFSPDGGKTWETNWISDSVARTADSKVF